MINLSHAVLFEHLGKEVRDVLAFADEAHTGQFRKYYNPPDPYIEHPVRVAARLIAWGHEHNRDLIMVALLHDVLEDTKKTIRDIVDVANPVVAAQVDQLTEKRPPGMNRAERKALYRAQLAVSCDATKVAKLADVWDNLSDFNMMLQCDPGFARQYLAEKTLLLECINPGGIASGPAMDVYDLIKGCHDLL